ncbi:hypothetical protein [Rhodanobacter hydrolyticus]|uniref:Uncharacterized protein n=1 Tax=Rhodanobacter hydrolyticus TaxID=2250595 RepID=A0ABW8J6C4_9GAMM
MRRECRGLAEVPRSNGLLLQMISDTGNFNNANIVPDHAASEAVVCRLAELTAWMRRC